MLLSSNRVSYLTPLKIGDKVIFFERDLFFFIISVFGLLLVLFSNLGMFSFGKADDGEFPSKEVIEATKFHLHLKASVTDHEQQEGEREKKNGDGSQNTDINPKP